MCGIAGIINFKNQENFKDCLKDMIGLMDHRGPDSAGIYSNGPVGLGHARLSIIDLEGGDQPIHNEDKTIWIVFNGEIFNYPEIRKRLLSKGHQFYTHTDTEVLVHLYEDLGPEMLAEINGQFAFSIWDSRKELLFIARDRVGIRPFFYRLAGARLTFGSEIKAVLADPKTPRELDLNTLSDIFTCWAPQPTRTAFLGVRQLPPGHFAVFKKSGLTVQQYWAPTFDTPCDHSKGLDEWMTELRALIVDATRIRLRADVPVGAYLSGGLDSTYTTSIVKHNFNNSLRTFSVRFANTRFDETSFQESAVTDLGTEHRDIICRDRDIGEIFPQIIWHTEVPILRTAPAPLFQLSRLVRQNDYKVVLTGEGADEMFAGYNIFKEDRVRRFWAKEPASKIRPRLLEKLYPYIFEQADGKASKYLEAFFKKGLGDVQSPVYSHILRWANTAKIKTFFSEEVRASIAGIDSFVDHYCSSLPENFMKWDPLSRAQFIEIKTFLSNYLLSSQGDRMAMANSVEGRYPFLDHRVIEFAGTVPPNLRMNGLNEKYLLKKAAEESIPTRVIKRNKQPYRAPVSSSFFGKHQPVYVKELLSKEALQRSGIFDHKRVKRLVQKCRQGQGELLSERENMALVGVISTQLLDYQFIRNYPAYPIAEPKNLKFYD